jgi:TatD DNase family protein
VNAGFYLSFNGTLTYKNSALPEVAKAVPLESILLETDCPFLPPVPYRGKRNEPAYLSLVLEKLKTIWPQRTREEIDAQIEKNSRAVFGFDCSGH